ncbi:MAG: tRNA (N(6)-L-threonylcarbamoyladenosine(37)-C(2))-methylthiotransferase MtaB, partial [Rhodopirellula sp. JB055]
SLDRPAITTDIIAGFPGETEEEFEQTLRTCREAGFSKIHAFPYSARRGTPAAERDDQLDKGLISERVDRLGEVEADLRDEYYRSLVGSNLELLVEEVTPDGRLQGTTCRYAPAVIDRPGHTEDAIAMRENDLINARVVDVQGDRLELA